MARVLLDMDGVLCDLVGKWFAIYNQEHHDTLRLEDMSEWGPHLYAKKGRAVYHYLSQPGFFRDLKALPGAVSGVRQLLSWGHDVVVVTAAKNGHRDKYDWVREHLPFLETRNIVFAHRKELVRGDVLFDDAPHNLAAFAPFGLPVAMAYPYNTRAVGERVNSWEEFLTLIARRFSADTPANHVSPSDAPRSTAAIMGESRQAVRS